MRVSLLILLAALSGCATTSVATGGAVEGRAMLTAQGPAQRSSGGRTQKVGLPLTRAQKIGLWTGVAVLLAYVMADSDDAEASAPVEGP